ncbi:MAG: DUF3106 domain-containing protein [Rugosibacter sp.]|nr:DUF3106 domain-containing protein [Rugosibacter sp.]
MARLYLALLLAAKLMLTAVAAQAFVAPLSQPSWAELSADQQKILAPLSNDWNEMDTFQRKKWLGIAQRYPHMAEEEKVRTQHRMTAWAKLTSEERKLARTKYKKLQKASPEKREAVKQKWEEYQSLPEDEKARLKSEAERKKKSVPGHSKLPISESAGIRPVQPSNSPPLPQPGSH